MSGESKACPHCGSAADKVRCPEDANWYACGTRESDPTKRGINCYRNQLAAVTAERDELRRRIDEAPVGHLVETPHDSQPWTVLRGVKRPYALCAVERVRLVADPEPLAAGEASQC